MENITFICEADYGPYDAALEIKVDTGFLGDITEAFSHFLRAAGFTYVGSVILLDDNGRALGGDYDNN